MDMAGRKENRTLATPQTNAKKVQNLLASCEQAKRIRVTSPAKNEKNISDCDEEKKAIKEWIEQTRIIQVYGLQPAPEHKYPWLVSLRHRATEERPRNGLSISILEIYSHDASHVQRMIQNHKK